VESREDWLKRAEAASPAVAMLWVKAGPDGCVGGEELCAALISDRGISEDEAWQLIWETSLPAVARLRDESDDGYVDACELRTALASDRGVSEDEAAAVLLGSLGPPEW
jgi:hypothetical protein